MNGIGVQGLKMWRVVAGGIVIVVIIAIFLVFRLPRDEKLRQAASSGNMQKVRRLVKEGANVNSANEDGVSALMLASSAGYADTVQELVILGANVNASAHRDVGDTALYYAVLNNHPDVVEVLVHAGSDPNAKMGTYSPLEIASRQSSVEVLRALVASSRLNVQARDEAGNTAIMTVLKSRASTGRKALSLQLLVQRGCDAGVANSAGETPCSVACHEREAEILAALGGCSCTK